MREGGEYISAADVLCNDDGCLTRLGDAASDVAASDQVHLTEKGSVFLVQGSSDRGVRDDVGADRQLSQ